jgi:hypothetical protein
MFNKKVLIKFIAATKEFLEIAPKPEPSSRNTPTWFKNTPSYIDDKKGIDSYSDPNSTIKKCMPVVDAMTSGYHILLPCDVWVYNEGQDKIKFQWAWEDLEIVSGTRKEQHTLYPTPDGFYFTSFKWINHWITKTPKGWSCLFTHPLHYDDLPFKCLTSMVDTDKYPSPVHFPFFLRKDFSGMIPKGTPIMQVIPFKREHFKSQFSYDRGQFKRIWDKAHTEFFDRYLKNFRTPKNFEQGEIAKCPFAFMHRDK